jgi:hypothetical protein
MSASVLTDGVPLTAAAHRLGRRYHAVLDLVLLGRLRGEQDPVTRRWFVQPDSLEAMLAERSAQPPAA